VRKSECAPRFSIVLPTHSRQAWLEEAIASVVAQTVDDWELVVVDDASSPPARVPDDARIRLVRLERNVGAAGARNAGLDVARGRYITFLDDDDAYAPERLSLALEGLERAPIAICWSRFMDRPAGSNRVLEHHVADTVLDESTPPVSTVTVCRDRMLRFDERWLAVEDVDWWLRVSQHTAVTTVPKIGLLIRQHDEPRCNNTAADRVRENLELLEHHAGYFTGHRTAAAFRLKRVGLLALRIGDLGQARAAFRRSLLVEPRLTTAWHLARTTGRQAARKRPLGRRAPTA
jgi:glycosyltransferase involved in cell wall biosynthesis